MPTCPACQHSWATPKKRPAPTATPALADLSDKALYAHYKAIAPLEDMTFVKAHGLPELVIPDKPTKKDALAAFDAFRARRRYLPPADEAQFWEAQRFRDKRLKGKEYRTACHALRATIASASRSRGPYFGGDTASAFTAYEETVSLVKTARKLAPHGAGLRRGRVGQT